MLQNIILRDITELITEEKYEEKIANKKFLITGATGLLAKYFTYLLLELNKQKDANIEIYILVRNKEKAEKAFSSYLNDSHFHMLIQDVCEEINLGEKVDYIMHAAGSASAYAIKNNPTGIIRANTIGTLNVLEYAKKVEAEKILFTSTREIYGKVEGKDKISESDMGVVDPLNSRNCYPESKRMAEAILESYFVQYGVKYNIARLAHVYGPTMALSNDGRVMADFLDAVLREQDIKLNSDGTAIRAFCYIKDAIDGLIKIIIKGEDGEAYNLANEKEPYMIRDVANKVVEIYGNKSLKVKYVEADNETKKGYLGYKITQLDTSKLERIGWEPKVSLQEGIQRTIESFNVESNK